MLNTDSRSGFRTVYNSNPTGKGTGLELSISYDVISDHGGVLPANITKGEAVAFLAEGRQQKLNPHIRRQG